MIYITRLNLALQSGLSKEIFDHIRNYLICATVLALGTIEFRHHTTSTLFGLISSKYAGIGVIGLSFILIAMNLYDGIRKLSKFRYHTVFTICLVMIYIFFSARVVEMTWNYRIG